MPAAVSGDTVTDGADLAQYCPIPCAAWPARHLSWQQGARFSREVQVIETFTHIQSQLDVTPHLLRLGRLFSETVLIEVDGDEYYLTFDKGRIVQVMQGPSRKTPWRFALRTDAAALAEFWQPRPAPGFHDVFGFVKIGRGRIDGDILSLVKNLRFFKEVLGLARSKQEQAA